MTLRIKVNTKEADKALKDLRSNLDAVGHSALDNEKEMRKLETRFRKGLEAKTASKATDELRTSLKLTRLETAKLQREIGDYGGALKTLAFGSGAAAKNLGALAVAAGAAAAYFTQDYVRDVIRVGVAYDSVSRSVSAVSSSHMEAAQELEFIRRLALDLGLALTSLETSYVGVLAASKGTALEGQGVQQVFKSIVTAGAVLGATGDQLQRVFLQVGQGIGRTRFELEDLKTIAEALPGVGIQDFAKALNVTTAEFFDMVSAREATVDKVLPAFANELLNRFGPAAKDAGDRAAAAFTGFDNSVVQLKRTIAQSGIMDFFADMARTGTRISDILREVIASDEPTLTSTKLEAQATILKALSKGWGDATSAAELYNQVSADLEQEKIEKSAESIRKWGAAWRGARKDVKDTGETTVKVLSDIESQLHEDKISAALQSWFGEIDAETDKLNTAVDDQNKFMVQSRLSAIKSIEDAQVSAWEAEINRMNARNEKERQVYEQFTSDYQRATMSTTDFEIAELNKRYDEYEKTIDDKAKLDEWYDAQLSSILSKETDDFSDAFSGWASSWSGTLNDMLWGAESTFSDILVASGKMFTQMMIQKQMLAAMDWAGSTDMWGSIVGAVSGAFGGGGASTPFGSPGVSSGGVPYFDTGGMMTSEGRKKHFPAMLGEGEVSGYPNQLKEIYGGSGGGVSVVIGDINVNPTGDPGYDQNIGRDVSDALESRMAEFLEREMRSGGMLVRGV